MLYPATRFPRRVTDTTKEPTVPQFRVRYVHPRVPRMHARFVVVEATDEAAARAKVEAAGWKPVAALELKEPEPIASLAAAAETVDPGAVSTAVDGLTSQAAGGSSGTPPAPSGSPEPTTPHPGGGRGRRGWGSVWSWADRDRAEATASGSTSAGTAAPTPPKPPPPPPAPPPSPPPPPPSPIPTGSSVTAVATAAGASRTRPAGAEAGVPPPAKPATGTGSGDPVVDVLQRVLKVLEDGQRKGQGTPGGGAGGKSRHEQAGSNLASQGWNWFTSRTRVGRAVGGVVNRSGAGKAVGDAVSKVGGKIGGAARLGGGAAAGGAAGALGGVAAVAAPVAIAVGAIGAMGAAAVAATKKMYAFGYSMEAQNRQYTSVSGSQASTWANLDVNRTMRQMGRGNDTAGSAGKLAESLNKLEEKLAPIETAVQDIMNDFGAVAVDCLGQLVDIGKNILDAAAKIIGLKYVGGEKEVGNTRDSSTFLDQIFQDAQAKQVEAQRRMEASSKANRRRW